MDDNYLCIRCAIISLPIINQSSNTSVKPALYKHCVISMFATDRLAPPPQSQWAGGVGAPMSQCLILLAPGAFIILLIGSGQRQWARSSYIMAEPECLRGVIHESLMR